MSAKRARLGGPRRSFAPFRIPTLCDRAIAGRERKREGLCRFSGKKSLHANPAKHRPDCVRPATRNRAYVLLAPYVTDHKHGSGTKIDAMRIFDVREVYCPLRPLQPEKGGNKNKILQRSDRWETPRNFSRQILKYLQTERLAS